MYTHTHTHTTHTLTRMKSIPESFFLPGTTDLQAATTGENLPGLLACVGNLLSDPNFKISITTLQIIEVLCKKLGSNLAPVRAY